MVRNITFLIFIVRDVSIKTKSASIDTCTKFLNCQWMKLAIISLQKGSGKRLKVREKSVKSQGIRIWILSGNPAVTQSINGTGWAVMVDQESVQKAVDYFNTGEVFITTYSLLVSIYSKLNKSGLISSRVGSLLKRDKIE